jgi:hypothetical protein
VCVCVCVCASARARTHALVLTPALGLEGKVPDFPSGVRNKAGMGEGREPRPGIASTSAHILCRVQWVPGRRFLGWASGCPPLWWSPVKLVLWKVGSCVGPQKAPRGELLRTRLLLVSKGLPVGVLRRESSLCHLVRSSASFHANFCKRYSTPSTCSHPSHLSPLELPPGDRHCLALTLPNHLPSSCLNHSCDPTPDTWEARSIC